MWIPYKSEFTSTSQGHIASSLPPLWSWQPVILDRTSKVWNLILWSSKWKRAIPSRITGTFTVFIKAKRAPWFIVVFITSHGNKFQRTPVTNSCTSASVDLSHQLEQSRYLTPTNIFYCQFILFLFVTWQTQGFRGHHSISSELCPKSLPDAWFFLTYTPPSVFCCCQSTGAAGRWLHLPHLMGGVLQHVNDFR